MKRIILVTVIIILLVALTGIIFVLTQHKQLPSNNSSSSTSTFPISGNSPQSNTSNGSGSYSVVNTMGGMITTKYFIHNGKTVVDALNSDDYYLAGSPVYCTNSSCPSAPPSGDYYVVSRQSAKAFIIGLLNEPLGNSRQEAEQFLMGTLGISENQMCNLNYYVLATSDVNSVYAGKNLGFSFCPGAIPLPAN